MLFDRIILDSDAAYLFALFLFLFASYRHDHGSCGYVG